MAEKNDKLYSFKAMFSLEWNARFADFNFKSVKGIIRTVLLIAVAVALMYFYVGIAKKMVRTFYIYEMEDLFLKIFVVLTGVAFSIFGITTMEKSLFLSGNNELLLRYPVKPTDVFLAKVAIQALVMLTINVVVLLPVFIVFGVLTEQTAVFYVLTPVIILLSTAFIFFISTVCSLPFMRIKAYTKDRYVLTLVLSIVIIAAGFALYMVSVQSIMNFMKTQSMSFFSEDVTRIVGVICECMLPFGQLANVAVGAKLAYSIPVALVAVAAAGALDYVVIKKHYLNSIYMSVETEGCSFTHDGGYVEAANFKTLLKKDFYEILRSPNYSFQYLAMSLAAPVMTFFCTRLAVALGTTSLTLENVLVPALAMLVVLIFVTIMVSFSATSISRMGDAFYMTKVSPIPYKTQILVKFVLYMTVSATIVILSVLVLVLAKYVDALLGLLMIVILLLFTVAETSMSIKLDIARPNFPIGDGDELQGGTLNTFISMLVGFLIAVVCGVVGIAGSFLLGNAYGAEQGTLISFGFIGGFALLYCVAMVLWLFVGLEKAYAKITPLR